MVDVSFNLDSSAPAETAPIKPSVDKTLWRSLLRRRRRLPLSSPSLRTLDLSSGDFRLTALDSESERSRDPHGCIRYCTQAESVRQLYGSRKASEKQVRWGTVDVHSHVVCLGDNPDCTSGPPLQISWKSFATQQLALDDYEENRPERRTKKELVVPRYIREDWLRNNGYARSQLKEATEEVQEIRKSRAQVAANARRRAKFLRIFSFHHRSVAADEVKAE